MDLLVTQSISGVNVTPDPKGLSFGVLFVERHTPSLITVLFEGRSYLLIIPTQLANQIQPRIATEFLLHEQQLPPDPDC